MNKILRVAALLLILAISSMAKKPVAIATIGVKPPIPNALEIISDEVMAAFSNSDEYEPYERTKEALAALGGEHKFQQSSGLVSENEIRKMGKMLGVDYMCLIQSRQFGNEFSLNARLVHIETGKVDAANAASLLSNLTELYKNSGELACKLLKNCGGERSVSSPAKAASGNTFTDTRDGKQYKIVKIGTQTWMAENLNYNASGSKCYENQESNCKKYGRLYNWNTAKKACPEDWHLPSYGEWNILVGFAGGEMIAGKKLKAVKGWNYDDKNGRPGNGTDEFGFAALPGGGGSSEGDFGSAGNYGNWWSATEVDAYSANYRNMGYNGENVSRDYYYKSYLRSVRCLQD